MVTWDPLLDITGDKDVLKVSATDVGTDAACGRYAALKTRPFVEAAAWQRSFIKGAPFPLGDVLDLVAEAHRTDGIATYPQMKAWLSGALDRRGMHRLLRPYVEVAVENVLDAHDAGRGCGRGSRRTARTSRGPGSPLLKSHLAKRGMFGALGEAGLIVYAT